MPEQPVYFIFASDDPNPRLSPTTVFLTTESQPKAAKICEVAFAVCEGNVVFDYASSDNFDPDEVKQLNKALAKLAKMSHLAFAETQEELPEDVQARLLFRAHAPLWSVANLNPQKTSQEELAKNAPESARLTGLERVHGNLHCAYHYARAYEAILRAAAQRKDVRSDAVLQQYHTSIVRSLQRFIERDPFLNEHVGPFVPIVSDLLCSAGTPFPERTDTEQHTADLLRRIISTQRKSLRAGGTLSGKTFVQNKISGVESETRQMREYAADLLAVPEEKIVWVTSKQLGRALYKRYLQSDRDNTINPVRRETRVNAKGKETLYLALQDIYYLEGEALPTHLKMMLRAAGFYID